MRPEDSDFSNFAAVRWNDLVRSAVFLGSTVPDAQDVAQTTLLRCFVSWSAVSHADDRDAYLCKVLLNCFRNSRRRIWTRETPIERLPEGPTHDPMKA